MRPEVLKNETLNIGHESAKIVTRVENETRSTLCRLS